MVNKLIISMNIINVVIVFIKLRFSKTGWNSLVECTNEFHSGKNY
jgi:hypothetical protein